MKYIIGIVVVCIVMYAGMLYAQSAEELQTLFSSKENYDIYYALSEKVIARIDDVEIIGIPTIGSKQFVEYNDDRFGKKSKDYSGYIDLTSIRAIVPHKTNPTIIYQQESSRK